MKKKEKLYKLIQLLFKVLRNKKVNTFLSLKKSKIMIKLIVITLYYIVIFLDSNSFKGVAVDSITPSKNWTKYYCKP